MIISPEIQDMIILSTLNGQKCNVILDLDNTLISAIEYEKLNNTYRNTNLKHHVFDKSFIIFERPHVQKFLDFLFKHFNVSVWSAGTKDYVLFIVKNIIQTSPSRKIHTILHYDHCVMSSKFFPNTPKDLRFLYNIIKGFKKSNTFIIDDLDEVYMSQPSNCIQVPRFDLEIEPHNIGDNALVILKNNLSKLI